MDFDSFDPRAAHVHKQALIEFLTINERTIRLRSSLTKPELIELVDDQKSRLRLHRRANVVIGPRTLRPRSAPNSPPGVGNPTRASPGRRSSPRVSRTTGKKLY
jgi:hypothetical protein